MKPLRNFLTVLRSPLRWLVPGMGIKRWVGLLLFSGLTTGLGLAYLMINLRIRVSVPPELDLVMLRFLPLWARAILFSVVGVGLMLYAVMRINQTLLEPFVRPGQDISEAVSQYRQRGRGPKIVALGGGTGLSMLLRGLKEHTSNITAIVTVADDGGSSGRLRRALGVLPPGDFRNCIAALSDDEALTTQLFQYRFGTEHHADADQSLGGHSFGNLFITAMANITGSFERALLESSRVLNIRGQVLPSTLRDVTLVGELVEEGDKVSRVEGESQITLAPGAIRRVSLLPENVPAYPGAIRALLDADLIVLGPGSLYTSLLPNLLVADLSAAIRASRAVKVYVCNTATQPGETENYSVLDHLTAIERHTTPGLFPLVLANSNQRGKLHPHLHWVSLDPPVNGQRRMLTADLANDARPWRHDSTKLAQALLNLLVNPQAFAPVSENSFTHSIN